MISYPALTIESMSTDEISPNGEYENYNKLANGK